MGGAPRRPSDRDRPGPPAPLSAALHRPLPGGPHPPAPRGTAGHHHRHRQQREEAADPPAPPEHGHRDPAGRHGVPAPQLLQPAVGSVELPRRARVGRIRGRHPVRGQPPDGEVRGRGPAGRGRAGPHRPDHAGAPGHRRGEHQDHPGPRVPGLRPDRGHPRSAPRRRDARGGPPVVRLGDPADPLPRLPGGAGAGRGAAEVRRAVRPRARRGVPQAPRGPPGGRGGARAGRGARGPVRVVAPLRADIGPANGGPGHHHGHGSPAPHEPAPPG